MLNVAMLYVTVAVLTSLSCCAIRREWYWELFGADAIMAGVGAWVGGALFGSPFGPTVSGIPVCACFFFAVPMAVLFNLFFAPQATEVVSDEAEPASSPPLDTTILNLPRPEAGSLADVA